MFGISTPAGRAIAGGSRYPLTLPLVNPDAESGDASGWTSLFSSTPEAIVNPGGASPKTGSYSFRHAANSDSAWWGQIVQIPLHLTSDVDHGYLLVDLGVWMMTFTDTDNTRPILDFFDQSGAHIGHINFGNVEAPTSWTEYHFKAIVPPLTRSIRPSMHGQRFSGTELSIYYDDFSLTLHHISGQYAYAAVLYAFTGATSGEVSAWTVDSGAIALSTGSPGPNKYGTNTIQGGSVASAVIHRDFSLPDWSAAIAAGKVSCTLNALMTNINDDDAINVEMQFRTAGGVNTGSAVGWVTPGTTGNPQSSPLNRNAAANLSLSAPTDAATVRVTVRYARVDGTVLDASFWNMTLQAFAAF